MNRRNFVGLLTALFSGCHRRVSPITGTTVGASFDIGHLLRSGNLPAFSERQRVSVAIVGGGVSGLSAGWWLQRNRVTDFRIFELEAEAGGNARYGSNAITAYPWGAHYVPLPTAESQWVRELFKEFGVMDANGTYNELYTCAAPQERLYLHGRWQDGLVPTLGVSPADLEEFDRFQDLVQRYKQRRDASGRKAFAIPMDFSSPDADLLELDRISIEQFLIDHGFQSPKLHWYVNYACRDDFGCRHRDVSAWAGIHYFASRDASDDDEILTWPEGNGWLVRRLTDRLKAHITVGALAVHIERDPTAFAVDIYEPANGRTVRVIADHVIFAAPTFLARFIVSGLESRHEDLKQFEYAPWLVANITLDRFPVVRAGAPLAWDNVIYDSDSLGYVVATHQSLATHQTQTVFTYYYALAGASPVADRERLLNTDWSAWTAAILKDLSRPHPEIRELVRNIDIMKWGHAMIRPRPGFVWGDARRHFAAGLDRLQFAHSDLSGFSIFEEAQYRGIVAAERVIREGRPL